MPRLCAWDYCDNELPDDNPRRRYCCSPCRQAAYRARRSERNVTLMTQLSLMVTQTAHMSRLVESLTGEVEELTDEVDNLRGEIKQLKLPGFAPATPETTPSLRAGRGKGGGVNLDDLESTFEIKTATSTEDNKSNFNFAISSALAVFGNANSLPDEVIHYGLRTKRLQPSHVTRKLKDTQPAKPAPAKESSNGNAKPLAGGEKEFAAPAFDDDDLDDLWGDAAAS